MPDAFGNPGTADAVGYGALGALALTNTPAAAGVAGGLALASTPYLLMARKVASNALRAHSPEVLASADSQLAKLATKDPQVNVLRQALRERGVAAASSQTANALTGR